MAMFLSLLSVVRAATSNLLAWSEPLDRNALDGLIIKNLMYALSQMLHRGSFVYVANVTKRKWHSETKTFNRASSGRPDGVCVCVYSGSVRWTQPQNQNKQTQTEWFLINKPLSHVFSFLSNGTENYFLSVRRSETSTTDGTSKSVQYATRGKSGICSGHIHHQFSSPFLLWREVRSLHGHILPFRCMSGRSQASVSMIELIFVVVIVP